MSKKKQQVTCRCAAYPFPHRKHSGNCESCKHGKDWQGSVAYFVHEQGEYCQHCADEDSDNNGGYERSETLSAAERNPSMCGQRG